MVGTGKGRFAADGRLREMNSGPANFRRVRKFRTLRNFAGCELLHPAKFLQVAKISQTGKFPSRKLLLAHCDTWKTED